MSRIQARAGLVVVAIVVGACQAAATPSAPGSQAPGASPAASTAASTAPAIKEGGTLIVAQAGDILRTDAMLASDGISNYVVQNVTETLVGLAPGTIAKLVPVLATGWTVSPDGLNYTFPLRQGVKFHDGTDFNAAAVKFNYDRWINTPKELQDYSVYAGEILGYGSESIITSVDTPDAYTVVIHLKRPNSSFLNTQTSTAFSIESPTALKAGGGDNTVTDISKISAAQGGKGSMVGTGPFMFKEWVKGDHTTIVKNPNYWNVSARAHVDQVIFKPVPEEAQIVAGLERGEFDIAQQLGYADVPTIKSNPKLVLPNRGGACNLGQIEFNQAYKPVDNVKIRQAVAYAVNKQSYVDTFFNGQAEVAVNWSPADFQYVTDAGLPKYDPAMAKQLIAESGETDLSIDFYYPSNTARAYLPDPKGEFEAITRDLEAVGFKIIPHAEVWSPDYLDHKSAGKFEMFLFGNNCDWAGIEDFLKYAFFGYVGNSPRLEFNYKNDLLDKTMNDALGAPDEATAQKLWNQATAILKADMPAVPLLSAIMPVVTQKYVKGFVPSGVFMEFLNSVWLDK